MKTLIEFYQTLGWAVSLLVMLTFLMAGTVKGMIGLGLPTVAMGMLGLAIAPAQAAALLIIPSIVTNAWQLAAGGQLRALIRRLWPMQLGIVCGTGFGMLWLGIDGGSGVVRALGAALLLYALSGLFLPTWRVAPAREPWLGPLCGVVTGVITSATGVFVIPAVPYLQALRLGKNQLVQALGLSFSVSTLALAAGLYGRGSLGGRRIERVPAGAVTRHARHVDRASPASTRQRDVVQTRLFRRHGPAGRALVNQRLAEDGLSMSIRRTSKSRAR